MSPKHGTPSSVQMHQARNEALCADCRAYLDRLQREGTQRRVTLGVSFDEVSLKLTPDARAGIETLALEMNVSAEMLMASALTVLATAPPFKRDEIHRDAKMYSLMAEGFGDQEIAKYVSSQKGYITSRRKRWGFPARTEQERG